MEELQKQFGYKVWSKTIIKCLREYNALVKSKEIYKESSAQANGNLYELKQTVIKYLNALKELEQQTLIDN